MSDADAREEKIELDNDAVDTLVNESRGSLRRGRGRRRNDVASGMASARKRGLLELQSAVSASAISGIIELDQIPTSMRLI